MTVNPQLGFPPPLLGHRPQRLPILFDDGSLMALAKPQAVLVEADSWFPRVPVLVEAIRYQSSLGKPEFLRHGIAGEGLWNVFGLDPECHGPALFARSREQAEQLRNQLGSEAFEFTFTFLSKGCPGVDSIECTLPMARHAHQRRMLVSHTTGKKASTLFERNASVGAFHLWTARTRYPRLHQIPLHAFESGLPVLGDAVYARSQPPLLSKLKRHYTAKDDSGERPLYEGPAYYLSEVRIPSGEIINCPEPPRWGGLIKQLGMHSG
jgi:23S rRNA-/tRNA-specific pseudouridylate synthase